MYTKRHTIQILLLVIGAAGFAALGSSLKKDGKLDKEPNVLHLKGSPFGRTLALAMRGPVDVYWHRGEPHSEGGHEHGPDCEHGCEHDHGAECEHGPDCEHDHGDEHHGVETDSIGVLAAEIKELTEDHAHHDCDEHGCDHGQEEEGPVLAKEGGVRSYLLDQIDDMRKAYYSRTNERTSSGLHKAYIMSETQRRLSLSFQMDPTNIACYGSYFLFLSEAIARVEGSDAEEGIIEVRQEAALNLANYTVQYCLRYQDEAPAMITGANAAHDYLQIHLSRPGADLKVAAQYLRILDGCLARFESIRREMQQKGTWEKFSVHRRAEMEGAWSLVRRLRDADHQIFNERSNTAGAPAAAPKS